MIGDVGGGKGVGLLLKVKEVVRNFGFVADMDDSRVVGSCVVGQGRRKPQ